MNAKLSAPFDRPACVTPRRFPVTADKVVCKVSNVDITARSCELTFKGSKPSPDAVPAKSLPMK